MADPARARKIADRIKVIVAEYLEFRLKDERLGFVTITDARVTGDLQQASVFYTVFGSNEDRQATAEVREGDSRGRHTTTHRELFALPGGALLVDTPGIRSLEIQGAEEGVGETFDDVIELAAACRFSDCSHDGEPGCAIRAALADGRLTQDRLASHEKLERELDRVARQGDPRARAEHRRHWRLIHKSVNEHMNRKYGADR